MSLHVNFLDSTAVSTVITAIGALSGALSSKIDISLYARGLGVRRMDLRGLLAATQFSLRILEQLCGEFPNLSENY